MNLFSLKVKEKPLELSKVDGLPVELYIVIFGYVEKYEGVYISEVLVTYLFCRKENAYKAYNYAKSKAIGRFYTKIHIIYDDGDIRPISACYGSRCGVKKVKE